MDDMMKSDSMRPNVCKCPHHKMGGVFAILFGLLFLGGKLNWVSADVVSWWPALVVAAGLSKLAESKCKCC